MWFAPTAADWQKPVLIQWQRTWEDAVTVSKETGRPILVCINMDGEIASEHYAGVRYRQPDITKLYEPYVNVIASVYRHNPRDHDEQGQRIPCPRFGGVTCGEHIAIESILYEKFMDGRRIAPRHIMVELDGSEVYDVFYAFDTASVFKAIETGITERKIQPHPVVEGDRSLLERVTSRDSKDRQAVEQAYQTADPELKRAMVEAAVAAGSKAPLEVLRLAMYDLDPDLNVKARRALAQADTEGAVDLIAAAMKAPMESADRDALIANLEKLGENSPRARTLAVVYQGLSGKRSAVDLNGWTIALKDTEVEGEKQVASIAPDRLNARIDAAMGHVRRRPDDGMARLELADAYLAQALDPASAIQLANAPRAGEAQKFDRLLFEDALRSALEAESRGASGWRVHAAAALASYYLGDREAAYTRAESAAGALPEDATSWNAMAVLAIFAEARQAAISKAVVARRRWPAQWLTDVHAAYSVVGRHPLGTEMHVVHHYDFLKWLGGEGQADRVLDAGLKRFKTSTALHDRQRARLLSEKGPVGLEATYAEMAAAPDAPAAMHGHAGYASLVAAEHFRRNSDFEASRAAYDRGIQSYQKQRKLDPDSALTADHFIAMAHAGRARILYEEKKDEEALDELLRAFESSPYAAATSDGLNVSPADTARMLRARFAQTNRGDLAAKLAAAMLVLEMIDPALLRLPDYERETPPPQSGR